MAEDLQALMQRIQKDAVDKAENEAAAIIARAKEKAAEIRPLCFVILLLWGTAPRGAARDGWSSAGRRLRKSGTSRRPLCRWSSTAPKDRIYGRNR